VSGGHAGRGIACHTDRLLRARARARAPCLSAFPPRVNARARQLGPATWPLRSVNAASVCLLYKFAMPRFSLSRNITHARLTHFPCLIAAFLRASGIDLATLLTLEIVNFPRYAERT